LHGGQLIFEGSYPELIEASETPTAKWLTGKAKLSSPARRKKPSRWLSIKEATVHNLKNLSIQLPLERLVGFCGVSGSGKSTLAIDVIGNEMEKYLRSSKTSLLSGQESLKRLIISERQTHRFSARSIPATYLDLMTPLRQLFAETKLAKARGYTAARFSLNKKGGRCEACQGLGQIRVNMQWMPDLFTPCEVCKGERYNYETLQITWENFNIADVLNLPVEKAFDLFRHIPSLAPKLELMKELGLEYLTLGQPFHILSGGEIQRLQLIADLGTKQLENTLYILDEPSAGLHFQDIAKLVKILHRLVDQGHSVIVVEHHLDLLSQMDWLVELGPGGGAAGGQILFEGPSKDIPLSTPTGRLLHQ
jgi:excinuclease ABC subunit A